MTGRVVVVPGPGLDADRCLGWGAELGIEVEVRPGDPAAVIAALRAAHPSIATAAGPAHAGRSPAGPAAGPIPVGPIPVGPVPVGIVVAPGPAGFDAPGLAAAVAAAGVPVVAVEPGNMRQSDLHPESTRLVAAGGRVLYGRGPETGRHALRYLSCRRDRAPDTLAYGPDPSQEGDLWCPDGDGPHPVAVLFHGGFWYHAWERDLMDGLALDLTRRGIAAWNVEYRRVGAGGRWPATGEDAARATDHLVALAPVYRLDVSRVVMVGHSAGAQLALWVAARGRRGSIHPVLVVGLATIADLEAAQADRVGGGSVARLLDGSGDGDLETALADASPRARLPIGVPQLLVHAVDDDIVPPTQTTEYGRAALAAGDDVSVVELERGGHFDLIDPRTPAWAAVLDVLVGGTEGLAADFLNS